MKKFLIIIGLFCGFIGNSWAECVLTESTDRTPSNEDLYPQNPYNESRMALICETGKCGDGEVVFAKAGHYRKDTKINEDVYYKCKLALDDRWVRIDPNETSTPCNDDEIDNMDVVNDWEDGIDLGRKQADNLYTGVCWKKFEEKCGVKCNQENDGMLIYCNDAGNAFWGCKLDAGEWAGKNPYEKTCSYVNPETPNVQGLEFLQESRNSSSRGRKIYSDGKEKSGDFVDDDYRKAHKMCWICADNEYYDIGNNAEDYGVGVKCTDNKQLAWCNWQKVKENKNTKWETDHCECLDKGMEWDTEKHDCVKKSSGSKTSGGKTGSGKTGSGKTGGGKQDGKTGGKTGATSDTKCGVKCSESIRNNMVYCGESLFLCDKDNKWDEGVYFYGCSYSSPETRVVGKYKERTSLDGYSFWATEAPAATKFDLFGTRVLKQGDVIASYNDDFCVGCVGYSEFPDGSTSCTSILDKAYCSWYYKKEPNATQWDFDENVCKCTNSGEKWDNGKRECVPDSGKQGDSKGTNINCSFNLGAAVKCRDGVQFSKNVSVSVSAETCDMYKAKVSKYVNEIAQLLCESRGGVDNVLTDAQVKNAADDLDRFFTNTEANASVWKNAEGKFNTARLASDATAGVILGTVGGIVSANIIKKKQVEKGFDALNCTIGGQKVADWGDEFTVGLHR